MSRYDEYEDADNAEIALFEQWKKERRQQDAARAERSRPVNYETDADPRELSSAAARAVIESGCTEEKALAASFEQLAVAAQRGDRRVRVDLRGPEDW